MFMNVEKCLAMRNAIFRTITQRVVAIPYRRFGTTYRSHIRGSRILLRMGLIDCTEKSVRNDRYSLRNSPEARSSHELRGGSLKSRKVEQHS